jgi:cyclopropane-fatty-acyl-phospholipid synthase
MPKLLRYLAAAAEGLIYGPEYAVLQYWIRHPEPLDPALVWDDMHQKLPPLVEWVRQAYPPAFARGFLLAAKLRQDHLLGIAEHYDVSNEFYELFLDKKYMFYSCADFPTGRETIEEAQTIKANFLLNLIQPQPGEKILDLGCGWGGMLRRIHEATGDKENLLGYTLSKEQVAYVQSRFGLNVEFKNFITCDYPREAFDKIYSIGAWEHVRHRDIDSTLAKLYQALKPGGRLVQHFFCPLTETIQTWILGAQIFFPGSLPPAYPAQVQAFERAGFRITHRSIHDYRPTLRAWYDNLVANRQRAIELVGVQTYNKYLLFFPGSARLFAEGKAMLVRYVLEKPARG